MTASGVFFGRFRRAASPVGRASACRVRTLYLTNGTDVIGSRMAMLHGPCQRFLICISRTWRCAHVPYLTALTHVSDRPRW